MMKRGTAVLILVTFSLFFRGFEGISQTKYHLAPNSLFRVEGSSTLHDWHMETQSAEGEGIFLMEAGQFKAAKSLTVQFPAETLKSGTKGLDNNAYKALNTQKNKEIRFVLKEFTGTGASFIAKGNLTIAGVTQSVSFPVELTSLEDKYTFEGSLDTKLTAFSITPPTALLGTVKTEDEVKISFKAVFQPTL